MKAIKIELLDLEPMTITQAIKENLHIEDICTKYTDGYKVIYPDGYKTWYPKNIVENKLFILDTSNDGSIIKEEDVKNFIDRYTSLTIGEKTTVVHAKTITGFEFIDSSSCVDPKNYSKELGTKYAMENIVNKLWSHLGFVLQWAKNGIKRTK